MPSQVERNRIYQRINQIKEEIGRLRNKASQLKNEIDSLKSSLPELFEARRSHERFSRTRSGRNIGYQGHGVDTQIANTQATISKLYSEKNSIFEEINSLNSQKEKLYQEMNGN